MTGGGRRNNQTSAAKMRTKGQQQEHVGEGHHDALLADEQEKLLERHALRVRAGDARGEAVEHFDRRLARPGDGFVQARQMQVDALVEHRVEPGEPDRAAEIARQVEQPGRVLQPLGRQRAERDVGDRHDREHHAEAAQDLRDEQLPRNPSPW